MKTPHISAMNSLRIDKPANQTRIVVAMSGGVDSSTTAGLMVEQGYEVIGVTLRLYDNGESQSRKGPLVEKVNDAQRIERRDSPVPGYIVEEFTRPRLTR